MTADPPLTVRGRRLLSRIVIAIAVAAALGAVGWHLLARQIEGQLLAWAELRRAEGYSLAWQSLSVTGFPTSFVLTIAQPRLAKDGWSGEASALHATWLPWRMDRIDLSALRLVVTGPDTAVSVEKVSGIITIENGLATQLIVDGNAAAARLLTDDLGRAERARMVIDRFDPATKDWQGESLAGKLTLWQAQPAPPFAAQLLFPDPFDLELEGAIKGPIASLAGWRDAGGTADFTRLQLAWGPLRLVGDATLALDAQMRPLGAGTAKLQGLAPVLDRLVAKGQIRAPEASIAKIVLGLLAQPTANGSLEVSVPLTAQDGKLFLGPVAVATLRPLAP